MKFTSDVLNKMVFIDEHVLWCVDYIFYTLSIDIQFIVQQSAMILDK